MTAKRDLKRRVRDRQAKTGESYTAARRHVVAAADGGERSPPKAEPIPVDAMVDLTATATTVGLRCKVLMPETLATALDPTRVLRGLRDVLLATLRDPTTDLLRAIGLHGDAATVPRARVRDPRQSQFVARLRAGFGATSSDGRALGFHVDGVTIVCSVWRRDATLLVCTLDDALLVTLSGLGATTAAALAEPTLVFAGTRYPLVKPMFVIGRHPTCDLVIRDGQISRRHAAILRTDRGWFIKDLESTTGLFYRGMQITNKKLEEGDVFLVGTYELRFTSRR
ncbi:MAG TPA: FHA domain-containing protein [Kofleriaceae bacterium]|nr:FHA domain-containing protein [Kofleriaceae bacterium]